MDFEIRPFFNLSDIFYVDADKKVNEKNTFSIKKMMQKNWLWCNIIENNV